MKKVDKIYYITINLSRQEATRKAADNCPAAREVVTQDYNIHIHKGIHSMDIATHTF